MTPKFCKFLLTKVMGWTIDSPGPQEEKCIMLGVPHTSIWDFVLGYLYYRSSGGKLKVMIKKEAFFWPVSWLLRSMGGFPVDRSNPTTLMHSLIHQMNEPGTFHLVICPEGTRKAVRKWKTGFHTISKMTGAPVYLGYYDWKTKHIGMGPKVDLTDDARADMDRIQKIYEDMHLTAKFPQMYVTH